MEQAHSAASEVRKMDNEEMEDRSFDSESLVLLVASAWQSARALAAQNQALFELRRKRKSNVFVLTKKNNQFFVQPSGRDSKRIRRV